MCIEDLVFRGEEKLVARPYRLVIIVGIGHAIEPRERPRERWRYDAHTFFY
jgi:hypothetical protein